MQNKKMFSLWQWNELTTNYFFKNELDASLTNEREFTQINTQIKLSNTMELGCGGGFY